MATNKKKRQRKQKQAQETAKARRKEQAASETGQENKAKAAGKSQDGMADSSGNKIPTEEERRSKGRVISFSEVRDGRHEKATAARENAKRYSPAKPSSKAAKRKVKYVLDKKAKAWLAKVAAIAVVIIAAIVIGIYIASTTTEREPANTATEEQKTISLTGITSQGKALIESTGKFDGFLVDEDGHSVASVYDTYISMDDADALKARGQYPSEGIFAYNEEQALRDKSEIESENLAPESDTVSGGLS